MKNQKIYISNDAVTERQLQSIKFLRKSIESNQLSQFVGWTKINPLQAFVTGKRKIKSYSDFTYLSLGAPLSLKSELLYTILQIVGSLDSIINFVKASEYVEILIVKRRYSDALTELDKLDDEFGLSLWSLDLKLTLKYLTYKESGELELLLKFQKEISKISKNGLVANYAYHKRITLEYDADVTSIQQSMGSRLKSYDTTEDFYNYLLYRLAGTYPETLADATHILFNENRASIIDIFTTLRDLIFYYGNELEYMCYEILDLEIFNNIVDATKFKNLIMGNEKYPIPSYSDAASFLNAIVSGDDMHVGESISRKQLEFARTRLNSYYMYLNRYISDVLPGQVTNREAIIRKNSAISIFKSLELDKIDQVRLKKLEAALFNNSDDERMKILSDEFGKSFVVHKYKAYSEINHGYGILAATTIAKCALINKLPINYLPIHKFTHDMEEVLSNRNIGTLESLIVCHFEYKVRPNKKSYSKLQEELDCFLSKEGLVYPHLLDINKYPHEYSEYYFREICELNIIDYWYILDTHEKLIDERIRCLKRLPELNPSFAKEIQNEIINFSTRSRTREILNSLNQSKLRIDMRILTDILSPKIELDFTRMLSKIDNRIIEDAEKKLKEVIKNRRIDSLFGKPLDDDVYSLMDYLIVTVAKEYIENGQIGLDHSLGSRIRHNIFLDEISSVFKESNLYLKKNDINRVSIMQYWSPVAGENEDMLATELTRFTLEINKLVNDFKDKYIHIKSEKYKDGVFFIDVNQTTCTTIIGLLHKDQSFSEFIDNCVSTLNTVELHKRVARMRELITEELEPQIQQRIAVLKKRFPLKNNEIDSIFRDVETGFNQSISAVSRWFSLESSITLRETYTAQDSFNTAKEILKNIDIEPYEGITHVFPEALYTHQVHEIIVYSLIILIDNSIKYSSTNESDLKIIYKDSSIIIEFSSPLIDTIAKRKMDAHWDELTKCRHDDTLDRFLENDTGSGLARIVTFIKYSENSSFNYYWSDGKAHFVLQISLNFVNDLISILQVSS